MMPNRCETTDDKVAEHVKANIRFEYLMAGHDLALIKSQEKAEDDVVQSIEDLKKMTDDDEHCTLVVYIGITCGLSAPYVGSQINWILNESHPSRITYLTVLMGFNDVSMARKTPIEGYTKTMHDIVLQLQNLENASSSPSRASDTAGNAALEDVKSSATVVSEIPTEIQAQQQKGLYFLINPIVGPEPIAGSSRMKGGSATKMMLEMIAARALNLAFPEELPLLPFSRHHLGSSASQSSSSIFAMLDFFAGVNRWTYKNETQIAHLIRLAGDTLKSGGHIYYLGEDSVSMIALIDASECPPTYGAEFTDIRAFVPSGWSAMANYEGDMSSHGPYYQISDLDFEKSVVPDLKSNDLIIVFHSDHMRPNTCQEALSAPSTLERLIKKAKEACPTVKFGLVSWSDSMTHQPRLVDAIMTQSNTTFHREEKKQESDQMTRKSEMENWDTLSSSQLALVSIKIPERELIRGLMSPLEISAKWVLNAISTGAHILKGKVWSNRMIDLNLSNDKLYRRGITLVSNLMGTNEKDSEIFILKSIYSLDSLPSHILSLPISSHYQHAAKHKQVVPIALLLASGKVNTVSEAKSILSTTSILRNAIADLISKD